MALFFSNFMNKGVFTFKGGTDMLIKLMSDELEKKRRYHLYSGKGGKGRYRKREKQKE